MTEERSVICVVSFIPSDGTSQDSTTMVYRQPLGDGQSHDDATSTLVSRLKRTLEAGGAVDTDNDTNRQLLSMIDTMIQNETITGNILYSIQ